MRVQLAPRIVVDSEIRHGKPTIEGTRLPVEIVVGRLSGSMSIEEIMNEYMLSREDVQAALGYAEHRPGRRRMRRLTAHLRG